MTITTIRGTPAYMRPKNFCAWCGTLGAHLFACTPVSLGSPMASNLRAIASNLLAMASNLLVIALRLEAIASGLEAIASRLEAIALRLEAIASRVGGHSWNIVKIRDAVLLSRFAEASGDLTQLLPSMWGLICLVGLRLENRRRLKAWVLFSGLRVHIRSV